MLTRYRCCLCYHRMCKYFFLNNFLWFFYEKDHLALTSDFINWKTIPVSSYHSRSVQFCCFLKSNYICYRGGQLFF